MTAYNPAIIRQYADALYAQAIRMVVMWRIMGILAGGLAGNLLSGSRSPNENVTVFGAIILGIIGLAIGRERAFDLKLKAQLALCRAQIEENTRAQVQQKAAEQVA